MIHFKCIDFSYGDVPVFSGFSLPVEGAVNVIEGASGCGKTTLLKLAAGLLTPSAGKIEGMPKRPAVMFQENRLLPWFNLRENVEAVLPRERRSEVAKWLELVELSELSEKLPGETSGGQQRRTALARALGFGGDILILDEPLKGLDKALITRLVPKIKALGIPIIVTSHSELETALWGGNVTVI
ncbi:MAG: ATP-binding cassette domain-containing protein [Oscillospiraceae bacterium]